MNPLQSCQTTGTILPKVGNQEILKGILCERKKNTAVIFSPMAVQPPTHNCCLTGKKELGKMQYLPIKIKSIGQKGGRTEDSGLLS
ncbi:hypothetical protein [Larkinella terrae]|uniref:Uncharacterized protein n=1 Tax=Larkinella terrae TaxID=2025311 RepID=A0A7K0EGS7_9BACT|nr:hypothetical protein [Larkinella terrae]MRS60771.1 hypothetical protein [Larkinella terrae]